jgi:cation:H+ antiporter
MPPSRLSVALLGFVLASVVTLQAARLFATRLDRLGLRLGLSEALIGVLTALAADGPELSSSVTALLHGERDVGLGTVLGSNAFNLAAMIGLGALVAGAVVPRRSSLLLEAVVAGSTTLAIALLMIGVLSPAAALVVCGAIVGTYVVLLVLGDVRLHLVPLPSRVHVALRDALGGGFAHHRASPTHDGWRRPVVAMAVALAAIVGGSVAMVRSALVVADGIGLSRPAVGLLVLAVVTSLPNVSTAIRLARQRRGDAAVSETLNSNTINLLGGIAVPAVVLGLGAVTGVARSEMVWLAALTAATVLGLARPRGMGRLGGAALIVAYAAFLASHLGR